MIANVSPKQGMKNFTRTAANLLGAMTKIDNSYYPEVSEFFEKGIFISAVLFLFDRSSNDLADTPSNVYCQCGAWIQKNALASCTKIS